MLPGLARAWPRRAPRISPRSFAAASTLSAPSLVDRPSPRELLAAGKAIKSLPPRKCIGSLAEVTSTAVADKKEEELLESQDFAELLRRVEDRLFGFNATEAYLLVSCLARLPATTEAAASSDAWPGAAAVRRLMQAALEQLSGEWQELSCTELSHAAALLSRLEAFHVEVDLEGLQRQLRVCAERGQLSSRSLCMAAAALRKLSQRCDEGLAASLASAAERLERLSPTQLSSLTLSLALLGQSQVSFVEGALQRLAAGVEELSTEALGAAAEAAALSRRQEVLPQLLRRCTEVAHTVSAGEAIQILRSCAALGLLTTDLTWLLLLQVAKVPRSSLAEAEEQSLHQVMLSLLHDPTAAEALQSIGDSSELWEACYRPEDVALERSLASVAIQPQLLESLQALTGLRVEQGLSLAEFYVLPLMFYADDGSCVTVDFDAASPAWLSEADPPTQLFYQLKEKHLSLWNIPVLWMRMGSPGELEGDALEALTRRVQKALEKG